MSREAMQMALDMLNEIADDVYCDQKLEGVITALRQALETDLARVGEVGVWGECEPQKEVEDGWCDWVCPKPVGYLMQCCDCGLIHEVDFRVVQYEPKPSEVYEVVDDPDLQAQMRLRRRDDISPKKPHQEPVAWMHTFIEGNVITHIPADIGRHPERWTPLYTAPPKAAEWVGLTDEERHGIREWQRIQEELGLVWAPMLLYLYEAIEAKLREKNT